MHGQVQTTMMGAPKAIDKAVEIQLAPSHCSLRELSSSCLSKGGLHQAAAVGQTPVSRICRIAVHALAAIGFVSRSASLVVGTHAKRMQVQQSIATPLSRG